MEQINLILSNRPLFKLNNKVESVLCGSTLPWAVQARRSVLIYTRIHALSFRLFLWMGNILSLIKQPIAIACSCYNKNCFGASCLCQTRCPEVHQVSDHFQFAVLRLCLRLYFVFQLNLKQHCSSQTASLSCVSGVVQQWPHREDKITSLLSQPAGIQ